MKFSVIVPTYNRETNISQVIQSIMEQDYQDWELLVIDDGSTDNTKLKCIEFAKKDERVKYFYKPNGGVSSARNYGMKNASGEFVFFLDSDNSLREGALRILSQYINKYAQIDFFCFGYTTGKNTWKPDDMVRLIGSNEIRTKFLPTHINLFPQDTNYLQNYVWNKCYRTAFLRGGGK